MELTPPVSSSFPVSAWVWADAQTGEGEEFEGFLFHGQVLEGKTERLEAGIRKNTCLTS
jgi:hypothetical protein